MCVAGSALTVMSTMCVTESALTVMSTLYVCYSEAASRWVSTSRLLALCRRTGRGRTPVGPPPGPAGTSPWPPGARPGPRAGASSAASSSSFDPRRQGAGWPERGAAPDTTVICTPRETVSSSLHCRPPVIMNVSGQ